MTFPIIYMYEKNYSSGTIVKAIKAGADINLQESSTGHNIIIKAILENDDSFIYQMFKVAEKINRTIVDKQGKNPIHHVVNSHKNGSYENTKLLAFLAKYYDINAVDNSKLPPIHYASL